MAQRVRVLNAAVNAEPFDVYITDASVDLTTAAPRLANLGFKGVLVATLGSRELFMHAVTAFGAAIAVGVALLWVWPA